MLRNIFKNHQFQILAHKLLYDLLLLTMVTALISVVSESILPGYLSQHLSPLRVFVVLLILLFALIMTGRGLNISYQYKTTKKSLSGAISIIFIFLLVGNSMLKFALWQNLIITLTTIAIIFLLYKTLISPTD